LTLKPAVGTDDVRVEKRLDSCIIGIQIQLFARGRGPRDAGGPALPGKRPVAGAGESRLIHLTDLDKRPVEKSRKGNRVRMEGLENNMNKKKLASFKKKLEQEKEVLEKQFRDLEEGNLLSSQSDFSGEMPFEEDYAASGTTTFERERDLSLTENVKDLLKRVDEALERIENGTYGTCEMCGERIQEERLKALPYANLCIKCKQEEEKAYR